MKKQIIGGLVGAALVLIGGKVSRTIKALKKENKELKAENCKYNIALDIYDMANKSLSKELDEKDELLKKMESEKETE